LILQHIPSLAPFAIVVFSPFLSTDSSRPFQKWDLIFAHLRSNTTEERSMAELKETGTGLPEGIWRELRLICG